MMSAIANTRLTLIITSNAILLVTMCEIEENLCNNCFHTVELATSVVSTQLSHKAYLTEGKSAFY